MKTTNRKPSIKPGKRASSSNDINAKIEQETRAIVGADIQRDINRSVNAAIAAVVEHFKRGRQVEEIMSKGMKSDPVAYAVGSLLVELSNEANIDYTHPRVAGVFYRIAIDAARDIINPGWPLQTCLRHLAILLNNPTPRTARRISAFWDDHESDVATAPERDPFPPERMET